MSLKSSMFQPPRLVLDTNVVMDLYHFEAPQLQQLAKAIIDDKVMCLANEITLSELKRVVGYTQFRLNTTGQNELLSKYQAHLSILPINEVNATSFLPLPKCRDPDDQMFLELAQQGHADILISRDKLVLKLARARQRPCPFAILSPEEAQLRLSGLLGDTPPKNQSLL